MGYEKSTDVVMMLENKIQMGFVTNHEYTVRSARTHGDIAISMIFSGSGYFSENGVTYSICPSHSYFRRPGHSYMMQLDANVLHERFFYTPSRVMYPMLKMAFPNIDEISPVHRIEDIKDIREKLDILFSDIKNTDTQEFWRSIPQIFDMIRLLTPLSGQSIEKNDMEYVKALLSDKKYYDISIPDIAEKANINYNTLRINFRKKYGISPHKYRISQKIEYAKSFLAGGKSISDTAFELGYPDIYSFSKEFSLYTGVSPLKYKENHIL